MDKTKEELMKEMELGNKEEDIYSDAGREELMEEEDEITDVDEGFMKGYEEGERSAQCPECKTLLLDAFIEEEIHDEMYRFCSSECATKFEKKKKE
jgi:hypothetical protein